MKKKKLILGVTVGIMTAMSLTACVNKEPVEPSTSAPMETTSEVAVEPTTENFEEDRILIEGMETVASDETEESAELKTPDMHMQTLVDVAEVTAIEDGRITVNTETLGEMYVTISENTVVSEGIKVGDMVGISHSNVMATSLPGIWPQVYGVSALVEKGAELTCEVYVPSTELINGNDTPYVVTLPEKAEGMDRIMFNVNKVVIDETTVESDVAVEAETVVKAETIVEAETVVEVETLTEAIEFINTVATVKEIMEDSILVSFDNTEAIALITEDTKVADGIEVGMEVTVVHTGIMTRSLPGQWPQVSEITISE